MKKVIVRLGNGLGNQLFTYAAAYSFAKKNNAELYVDDESGFHKKHKGYKQSHFFWRNCERKRPKRIHFFSRALPLGNVYSFFIYKST